MKDFESYLEKMQPLVPLTTLGLTLGATPWADKVNSYFPLDLAQIQDRGHLWSSLKDSEPDLKKMLLWVP